MVKKPNIQTAIDELHRAYELLNKAFYNGELPDAAITIQTKGKRMAMGWCSTKEIWKDKDEKVKLHEINISAEFLNIPFMDTMDTLMHEMVHLYNAVKGIKDCSRGGTFHNKKFKEQAEARGFYFDAPADKKYGWSFCKLTDETKAKIEKLGIKQEAFTIARIDMKKMKTTKASNSHKVECPNCGSKVRASKEGLKLICGDCSDIENGEIVMMEYAG